jgi:transposase
MSRQKKKQSTKTRRKHPPEFKSEALALADRVGVSEAARQLKLQSSQLYSWRTQVQSEKQKDVASQALATENARLKRQLAEKKQELEIIEKAAAYFAKDLK